MNRYIKIISTSGILFFALLSHAQSGLIQLNTVKFDMSEPMENSKEKFFNNSHLLPSPEYPESEIFISEIISVEAPADLFLREDNLLSQQIEYWAKSRGYKLLWRSDKDYLIYKDIYVHGKKDQEVLGNLGNLLSSQTYNLNIKLYKKNNVIVIEEN